MARQRVSAQGRADAIFSEITVERFMSRRSSAESHVHGRNRRVAQVLGCLSRLRGTGRLPSSTRATCVKAAYIHFNASDGNEAAHYLPGQIMVKPTVAATPELPWDRIMDPLTRERVNTLFGDVQDLPADFNHADTYAEQHTRPGLKQLFADACTHVLADPTPSRTRMNRARVETAYADWVERSAEAYHFAAQRKTHLGDIDAIPPGTGDPVMWNGILEPHPSQAEARQEASDTVMRRGRDGSPTATRSNFADQVRILEIYREVTLASALSGVLLDGVDRWAL